MEDSCLKMGARHVEPPEGSNAVHLWPLLGAIKVATASLNNDPEYRGKLMPVVTMARALVHDAGSLQAALEFWVTP